MGNPNSITNKQINSLGWQYLVNREQEKISCCFLFYSFSHRNHPAATHLNSYSDDSSPYEKWQYLADVYATLASIRGELGNSILMLFKRSFNANNDFDDRLQTYRLVNPVRVNENGRYVVHCLQVETQQDISRALKIIIADYYLDEVTQKNKLNHSDFDIHEPSTAIDGSDLHTFSDVAKNVSSPFDITSGLVNNLGLIYLTAYPEDSFLSKIKAHSNHRAAKSLCDFKTQQDSYSCWIKLADTYAELVGSNGNLSDAIFALFHNAFQFSVYTYREETHYSRYGNGKQIIYFNPNEISAALKGIVHQYYENYARAEHKPAISLDH